MNDKSRETELDRLMAGWPGLFVVFFAIGWMLLVANDYFPGIGWIFGRWGILLDILPGFFSMYLIGFGILGERTWFGKGVRITIVAVLVALFFLSGSPGGGDGSRSCSRATPHYC